MSKLQVGDYALVATRPEPNQGVHTPAARKAIVGHVGVIVELIDGGDAIVAFPHGVLESFSAFAYFNVSVLTLVSRPAKPIHPDTFPPLNEAPVWYEG